MESHRVYRMGWSTRVLGIFFCTVGVFFLVLFWGGALAGTRETSLVEILFPVLFLLVGGLFTVRAFSNYIYFSGTEISMQTARGRKTLPIEKVRGCRRYVDDGGETSVWHFRLEPNDDRFPTLDFEQNYYNFDDAFLAWIRRLPDLDELDKVKFKTSNFGLA